MKAFVLPTLTLLGLLGFFPSVMAQGVDARYPYRLPDWLWESPSNAHLLNSEEVLGIRSDIAKLNELGKLTDSRAADSLQSEIARRLASKFSARDLLAGAYVAPNPRSGVSLAIQFDPSFSPEAKATLQSAATRFVDVALEPGLIKKAFERSTATPPPMPNVFETKDGKQQFDEIGRPVFTDAYAFYLKQRPRPVSPRQFEAHLRSALAGQNGEAAVLLISSYTGNVWWGGSYYGYFTDPLQQLVRENPARGYFYIRLNAEKLLPGEAGWNDSAFWASKIAHELLHNLGYWHPSYKDPMDRDSNNAGNNWAFIVSYEAAIYDRLKSSR